MITLLPDPHRGMWPDLADSYQIMVAYDGAAILNVNGAVPADALAPVSLRFPCLPVGGPTPCPSSLTAQPRA